MYVCYSGLCAQPPGPTEAGRDFGQCGGHCSHCAGWRTWTCGKPGFASVSAGQTCSVLCRSEDRVNGQAYDVGLKSLVSSQTAAAFKPLIPLLGCAGLPWDLLLEDSFKQHEG